MSANEAHGIGDNVVFGHLTNFWRRGGVRDQHKRLAEYAWKAFDVLLVSGGRVCIRTTAVCHIPGDSNQKRRWLTAWDRVAIKGQHLMLGFWHVRNEIANALRSLVGIPVPTHG